MQCDILNYDVTTEDSYFSLMEEYNQYLMKEYNEYMKGGILLKQDFYEYVHADLYFKYNSKDGLVNFIDIDLESWNIDIENTIKNVKYIKASLSPEKNKIILSDSLKLPTLLLSFDKEVLTSSEVCNDFIDLLKICEFRTVCFSEIDSLICTAYGKANIDNFKKEISPFCSDELFLVKTYIKDTDIEVMFAYLDGRRLTKTYE